MIVRKNNERMSFYDFDLKVQSCKLYNNKHTIASTQIPNTEIFAFIAVLVFWFLIETVKKLATF